MDSHITTRIRTGVVDLGSNSVRLVVYEGLSRNPHVIFNEKAVLGLGRGLHTTGELNEAAAAQALTVLGRYHALARGMGAEPLEVMATAAVRDATNGAQFLEEMARVMPGARLNVLTGEEEARLSAEGLLLGVPMADGVLGDLGGGSLELVRLSQGRITDTASLPIGTIRLGERAEGDATRARAIAEAELKSVPWLGATPLKDLFLVGGTFRALARIHIVQTGYPLNIVHHYAIRREEARDLAGVIMNAPRKSLERMPAAPSKRLADLPFAAVVMRRLLRASGAARVVFSANGLREGWYAQRLPPASATRTPCWPPRVRSRSAMGATWACRPPCCAGWNPWPRRARPTAPCGPPPAGSATAAAATTLNTAPNRPSCGCCGCTGWGWTTMPAPISRWWRRCATRPTRWRPSWPRRGCCSRPPPRAGPRPSGPRCGWATPFRAACPRCWKPRTSNGAGSGWCCASTRGPASSRAKACCGGWTRWRWRWGWRRRWRWSEASPRPE